MNGILGPHQEIDPLMMQALIRRFPQLAGSANPALDLMKLATQGATNAAARSPGADFQANGGSEYSGARDFLRELYNMQNFTPPGFIDPNTGLPSPYQGNMLPNPRLAR